MSLQYLRDKRTALRSQHNSRLSELVVSKRSLRLMKDNVLSLCERHRLMSSYQSADEAQQAHQRFRELSCEVIAEYAKLQVRAERRHKYLSEQSLLTRVYLAQCLRWERFAQRLVLEANRSAGATTAVAAAAGRTGVAAAAGSLSRVKTLRGSVLSCLEPAQAAEGALVADIFLKVRRPHFSLLVVLACHVVILHQM
jgi:hypothetical protein